MVPPGTGIVHQVNLEYLATVVATPEGERRLDRVPRHAGGHRLPYDHGQRAQRPGLGSGRNRGGGGPPGPALLHAGCPRWWASSSPAQLPEGSDGHGPSADDRPRCCGPMAWSSPLRGVLTGRASARLSAGRTGLPSPTWRPEYGATVGFFPIDDGDASTTCASPGGAPTVLELVESYATGAGAVPTPSDDPGPRSTRQTPVAGHGVRGAVSLAGPKRPQDRVALHRAAFKFPAGPSRPSHRGSRSRRSTAARGPATARSHRLWFAVTSRWNLTTGSAEIRDGTLVIAAITSCTNTSNPSVMVGAGLLARNAVERGLAETARG